jgi:hypothetical protein
MEIEKKIDLYLWQGFGGRIENKRGKEWIFRYSNPALESKCFCSLNLIKTVRTWTDPKRYWSLAK